MGDSGDQSLVGGLGGAAGVRALSVEGVLRSAQHPLLDLRVDGSLRVVGHVVRQELHVLCVRLFLEKGSKGMNLLDCIRGAGVRARISRKEYGLKERGH